MIVYFVVEYVKNWPIQIPGVEVVSARSYLTDPKYFQARGARVFNVCRSYRYQSVGYYVSLLAEARGHRVYPSVATIQDMRSIAIVRLASDEREQLIQRSLRSIKRDRFTLSIYFGRNLAKRYDQLSARLFGMFQAPLLRAELVRIDGKWQIQSVRPIAVNDIPEGHRPFVARVAEEFLSLKRRRVARRVVPQFDMAILVDPSDPHPPSNSRAIRRFCRAAKKEGFGVELIEKDAIARLAEFDALFIRATTQVNHHTYRFAQRAAAEGLVVMDDPESIARCTNKVYLAELLGRHDIPSPRTLIVHKDNRDEIEPRIGLPCILKTPDSSFSQGVIKVETQEMLAAAIEPMLEESDLIIAQEFMPTTYDWRVGIIDGTPLWVCKYFMADNHWQIINHNGRGETDYGNVGTVPVDRAPPRVLKTALKATDLIGDGLYGVDLKQVGSRVYVIEINDNPSIDAGFEDAVLGDELYLHIMRVFRERIVELREVRQR